jgi:hypothetical protein
MKKEILSRIKFEIGKLNEQDVEGHVWWNKFKTLVEETPEPGEQQEIIIDLKKFTVKEDIYKFKDK